MSQKCSGSRNRLLLFQAIFCLPPVVLMRPQLELLKTLGCAILMWSKVTNSYMEKSIYASCFADASFVMWTLFDIHTLKTHCYLFDLANCTQTRLLSAAEVSKWCDQKQLARICWKKFLRSRCDMFSHSLIGPICPAPAWYESWKI